MPDMFAYSSCEEKALTIGSINFLATVSLRFGQIG